MNVAPAALSGVVLAGGQSRRMGRDKASIAFEGTTLLERSIRLLLPFVSSLIVAADRLDRYTLPNVPIVADPLPDCGPLGGILAALEASSAKEVFVLACDLPLVTPALVRTLCTLHPGSHIVIPSADGVVQPLCGRYPRSIHMDLRHMLERGERAVLDFVRSQHHHILDIAPGDPLYSPHLLWNVNTEDDVRIIERLHR